METKTCTKCGETKAVELFPKGRHVCRVCYAAQRAQWRANNREKTVGYSAKWREANRDLAKKRTADWAKANPNRERERQALYRAKHPERIAARNARNHNEVSPCYVAHLLGVPAADLTPGVVALKREQILNHRVLKELEQTLKEVANDE